MATALLPSSRLPSESHPEVGCVVVAGLLLSEGERWVDDGHHVIRSTEFDLFGEGDSLQEAVHAFIAASLDFRRMLDHLEPERITSHERDVLSILNGRFIKILDKAEELAEKDPLIKLNWPRRRERDEARGWRSRSKHGSFSQPSRV